MMLITMLARVGDAFPLAESMEDEKDHRQLDMYKKDAKAMLKRVHRNSPPKTTVEAGEFTFHYLVRGDVVYLTICDRSYPKRLAFSYLDELHEEFEKEYGSQVNLAQRPYAFIKFDQFIQRTKRLYVDTRTQRNLNKLNENLGEVENILKTNIAEVLGRGERLDGLAEKSTRLQAASSRYVKSAKYLNTQLWLRKYAPVAAVSLLIIILLYIRFG